MRWRRIAVWVYVAVGIACGAVQRTDVGTSGPAAASSASAASAEPESAVETPDGAEPAVVIWQRSPDDSVVSRLVSLTGRRLEERDEPVVVVGNDLYAVRGRPFDVVACDCDGCDAGDCANATTHHASSITPFLVPLGPGKEVSIVEPFVSDGCGENSTGIFDRWCSPGTRQRTAPRGVCARSRRDPEFFRRLSQTQTGRRNRNRLLLSDERVVHVRDRPRSLFGSDRRAGPGAAAGHRGTTRHLWLLLGMGPERRDRHERRAFGGRDAARSRHVPGRADSSESVSQGACCAPSSRCPNRAHSDPCDGSRSRVRPGNCTHSDCPSAPSADIALPHPDAPLGMRKTAPAGCKSPVAARHGPRPVERGRYRKGKPCRNEVRFCPVSARARPRAQADQMSRAKRTLLPEYFSSLAGGGGGSSPAPAAPRGPSLLTAGGAASSLGAIQIGARILTPDADFPK